MTGKRFDVVFAWAVTSQYSVSATLSFNSFRSSSNCRKNDMSDEEQDNVQTFELISRNDCVDCKLQSKVWYLGTDRDWSST